MKTAFLELERQVNRRRYRQHGHKSPATVQCLLAYHTVCGEEGIPLSLQGEAVAERDFHDQLRQLLNAGFVFLSLYEWMTKARPPQAVVLTFDDGYSGVFHRVFPLLQRYHLPATLFITTDFINGKVRPPWGSANQELQKAFTQTAALWAPLDWEQIRQMADSSLVEIGSHGCTHRRMGLLPTEEAKRELLDSKEELQKRLGRSIHTFSYPFGIGRYGAFSPHWAAWLQETGYIAACTAEEGRPRPLTNPFFIPRYPVRYADSAIDVQCKVLGLTGWSSHCQRCFHLLFAGPHVD